MTATPVGDGSTRQPITTFRTQLQRPMRSPPPRQRHQMLAPLTALPIPPGDLVERWFEVWARHTKAIRRLLLADSAPYLYAEDKLMAAFIAVEEYHDAAIGGTTMDPNAHNQRVDAIVAAAPVEHRKWAEDVLRGKNTKGQTRKLNEVIERAGTTGVRIIEAVPKFVELAVSCRSKISHPSPLDEQAGARYLAATFGLRWLLRHCLLVDLGCSTDDVGRMLESRLAFRDDLELMGRWAIRSGR